MPVEDPARTFWIIKHGIKASGMPAWGKSIDDRSIWEIVAFLRKLPMLSEHVYEMEVAASEGHSHDGDEPSREHHHDETNHQRDRDDDHSRSHAAGTHDTSVAVPETVTEPVLRKT